jgi:hypothetical protein
MIPSRHPNSGQNKNIRIPIKLLQNVTKLKYLGGTLTNQNDMHLEIKYRLNSGNACYYSAQNIFSSLIKSKKPRDKNIQNCNFANYAVRIQN